MKLETVLDLYALISKGTKNVSYRNEAIKMRKIAFDSFNKNGFTKIAFDTRRIDQGLQIIPRRGLQNYSRSEQFITEAINDKINDLIKLKDVLIKLKEKYGQQHDWHDSYARVLLSTIENAIRSNYKDGDITESQPAVGSLDYVEELLYVRYRLSFDDLKNMNESELERIILAKDEDLIRSGANRNTEISKTDVANKNYDTLLEKLFGGVKATKENPEVERTVTITIKDKFTG